MRQLQSFAQEGDQHVRADGDPDLGFHGVVRGAIEGLDAQMLLHPLEEQLDLPSAAVELGDHDSGQGEIIGQKDQLLPGVGIDVADAPQGVGILLPGKRSAQDDRLVEANADRLVCRSRIAAPAAEVALGPRDEKCAGPVDAVQAAEVQVAPVHNVEGARFEEQIVEDVDVVDLAWSNDDKGREVSPQVQQSMHLDGALRPAKLRPREQRQAQVDRGGVQGIGDALQIGTKGLVRIEPGRLGDQDSGKVAEDPPIPLLVGLGQGAFGHGAPDARVIEFGTNGFEARFDVPQAFAIGQLGKAHDLELSIAAQPADVLVPAVAGNALVEFIPRNEIHQLAEHGSSFLHGSPPAAGGRPEPCKRTNQVEMEKCSELHSISI